jgi:hypothetical protein
MRENAEAAPAPPWRVEPGHLGGMPEYVRSADETDGAAAECWRPPGAGAYIASWHPGVTLAVADLLESFASCGCDEDGDHWPEKSAALRAARLFLGETESAP